MLTDPYQFVEVFEAYQPHILMVVHELIEHSDIFEGLDFLKWVRTRPEYDHVHTLGSVMRAARSLDYLGFLDRRFNLPIFDDNLVLILNSIIEDLLEKYGPLDKTDPTN